MIKEGENHMFCEFDEYLKEFQTEEYAMDYWYDEGFTIAQDMLEKFTEEDWVALEKASIYSSIGWKKRLAYCLHNGENLNELNILLALINNEDKELFELCVDSLRSFTTDESKRLILKDLSILRRVEDLLPTAGVATKKILEDFLEKIKN